MAAHPNALGAVALEIDNSAEVNLQSNLPGPVQLSGLSINGGSSSPTASMDVTNNNVIVANDSFAVAQTTYGQAVSQVKNAFDNFAWDKPGITSSTVQNDVTNLGVPTSVAVVLNNSLLGSGTAADELFYGDGSSLPQVAGISVNQNSVLMKYTLLGRFEFGRDGGCD